jgi:hypothetical protein
VKPSKYGRVPARTTGQEAIELVDGRRIEFATRTKSASRGLSCDLLVLDEAMFLPEADHAAAFFTGAARPNPQVWYTGSAVDQHVHDGVVFARLRERAIAGDDDDLAWFEWSLEGENPSSVPDEVLRDLAAWAQANPALGIRIRAEHVEKERRSVGPREFAVERLGIGDWPRTDHVSTNPLDFGDWMALADPGGVIQEPLVVAFDVSPERKAALVVAGRREDSLVQGELVESKSGTAWVAPEVARIVKAHKLTAVCDGRGPASRLAPELRDLGVEVDMLNSTEHGQACGHLMDAIDRRVLRHLNDAELNGAVRAASTRPLGDAWAWSRKDSSSNIAPLVAFTLAVSAASTQEKPRPVAFAWA